MSTISAEHRDPVNLAPAQRHGRDDNRHHYLGGNSAMGAAPTFGVRSTLPPGHPLKAFLDHLVSRVPRSCVVLGVFLHLCSTISSGLVQGSGLVVIRSVGA